MGHMGRTSQILFAYTIELSFRCSRLEDCPSGNVRHGFIPSDTGHVPSSKSGCPVVETVIPANASLTAPVDTEVAVTFNFLPPPQDDGIYRCIFDAVPVLAEYVAPATLKCNLPPLTDRPKKAKSLDSDIDTVPVQLKLWSSASSTVFYEVTFAFYDCGAHKR